MFLGLASSGLFTSAALAQTAPQDAAALPPVVVSATTYPQPLSAALPSVSVITREQIEDSGAKNLTTLLQQVAGVQMTADGGPGQVGNIFIRGFSGPDVLVLLDGVPLNAQDASGNAYLSNLTTDQIERVEIIHGNVSAIYGSGAIGGAVLITTRRGGHTPRASISVSGGSRATATVSANASGEVGNTQLQAGWSRYTTQGIPAQNPEQSGLPNLSDGYRNSTANGSIVQRVAPGQTIGLRAFTSDGQLTFNNTAAGAEVRQRLYQLFSTNQIAQNWNSHLDLSEQTTDYATTGLYAGAYRTRIGQLQWRNVVQLAQGWTATGGLDLQHQSINTTGTGGIPATSRDANAVFAGLNGTVAANQIQLNVRQDRVDGFSDQTTGYVGYGRELGRGFKAIASYSTAFNVPPLGYLYYQDPFTIPNPFLQPEKAHSAEAGLQWAQGADVVRATLFETRATNQWVYAIVDPATFTGQFQNIASARTRGFEVSARGMWLAWAYDANLTLQDPVNTSPNAGNATLPLVARTLANLGVNHPIGSILAGAVVHFSGPRTDPYTQQRLGAYTTVDLTAVGQLSSQWSWNARVQNLFDKKYQTNYGYNREPFGVFVGVTWRPLGS